MRWPVDHPAVVDPGLIPWAGGADEVAPGATVLRVLRHLSGRRVASLVELGDRAEPSRESGALGVLKVFASPRARGNDRRLRALAAAGLGDIVPVPLGVDRAGHLQLVSFVPGSVFDGLDGATFVDGAQWAGALARRLHASGADLDRRWTWHDEVTLLAKRATPTTRAAVDSVIARTAHLADEPLVAAHRDCHPKQLVLTDTGAAWIDLDDAALAPAALDVGNLLAHLHRDAALGVRDGAVTDLAVEAVLAAYGAVPGDLAAWTELALVRLAGLAETRHGSVAAAERILSVLPAVLPAGSGR